MHLYTDPCDRPRDCEVPECRLARMERKIDRLLNRLIMIDQALANLQAAQAAEDVQLGLVAQAVTDEITRVNTALASLPVNNDPAIQAVADDITASTGKLSTLATALAAVAQPSTPTGGSNPTLVATTTTVTTPSLTVTAGAPVAIEVTVEENPTGTVPSGSVELFDGTTSLGTGTLDGTGAADFTVQLAVGGHSITANYSGDTANAVSTSEAVSISAS
jgi:hypothetical protein